MPELKLNLQYFAEEEGGEEEDFSKYITDDGGLDIDSLVTDFKEPELTDELIEESDEEAESDADNSEEGEGGPESHEDEQEEDETHVNKDEPAEKKTPDAAFAEMRRRAEQNEKMATWVQELATKQGFSDPEQLIAEFNKQQLVKEAQEKGVPVDVYERLQQLEHENKSKDDAMFQERFNSEVEATKQKYSLTDEKINETFSFMAQRGFIDENGRTNIPFEDAYTLANKDTFIKEAEERAKQSYLESKEKKQKQAAPNPGTGATDGANTDDIDLSTEAIFNTLDKLGIDYN